MIALLTATAAEGQRLSPHALSALPPAAQLSGVRTTSVPRASALVPKATSGTFWSVAGAAGGLLIGVLVGESIRQGTATEDSVTNEYNSKMATTVGLGLLVPLGAALGAAHGVSNIGSSSGKKSVVKGVAVLTAYTAAAIVIGSKIKRDDPDLTRFEPSKELMLPLPLAAVLTSVAAALITDAATTP